MLMGIGPGHSAHETDPAKPREEMQST